MKRAAWRDKWVHMGVRLQMQEIQTPTSVGTHDLSARARPGETGPSGRELANRASPRGQSGAQTTRREARRRAVGGEIAQRIDHACTPRHPCPAACNRRRALGLSKPFGGRPACWSKGRSSPRARPGVDSDGVGGLGSPATAPSLPVLSKLPAGVGLGRPNPPLVQQEGHVDVLRVECGPRKGPPRSSKLLVTKAAAVAIRRTRRYSAWVAQICSGSESPYLALPRMELEILHGEMGSER